MKDLTNDEIISYVWSSFREAKQWKTDKIDPKVVMWKSAFNGDLYGNEQPNRSKHIDRTVFNYVNNVTTNMLEPLINTNDLVRLASNTTDPNTIDQASATQDLLNYQFNKKNNTFDLFDESVKLFVGEGFSCSKIFWDLRSKELVAESLLEEFDTAEYKDLPLDIFSEINEIHNSKNEYATKIERKEDNEELVVSATFMYTDKIAENPSFVNLPLENLYWSPNASNITFTDYDCNYIIEHKIVSNSDLRGLLRNDKSYEDFTEEEIEEMLKNSQSPQNDGELESYRKEKLGIWNEYYEMKKDANIDNKSQLVFEFHGYLDIDQDGIDELVHLEILGNEIIKIEENPYLNDMIPYNVAVFDKTPFTVNGTSIPDMLLDIQKIRTAIMRNMQDSLAFGLLQNYITEKGTFDKENKKRLLNLAPGEWVEANKNMGGTLRDKVHALPTDNINRDFFAVFETMEQQAQEITGITAYTTGLDSGSLNNTATGVSIITQNSMKKIWRYTKTYIERMLKPTVEAYLIMNKMNLSEVSFKNGLDKNITISKSDIDEDADIDVNVAIKGFDTEKIQQITQLMNLTAPMVQAGALSPEVLKELVKELTNLWEMPAISNMIDATPAPQMNPDMQGQGRTPQNIPPQTPGMF